jgi:hypothetical protein
LLSLEASSLKHASDPDGFRRVKRRLALASTNHTLDRLLAKAFKRALAEERLDVAEHLLMALERLERDGPHEATLEDAYLTMCRTPASEPLRKRQAT